MSFRPLGPEFILSVGLAVSGRDVDVEARSKDEDLLREYVRSGRPEHFSELVTRHKEKAFRLAVSVLGPSFEGEAEEVTQEAFLAVHQGLKKFDFKSKFSTWLYRITYNRAIDYRRKPRYRYPHSRESALSDSAVSRSNPYKDSVNRERKEQLLECVRSLGEPHRSVVYLYYWLDSSISEIAELLDLKTSTVKSHLFRARKRLATIVKEEDLR